MSDSKIVASEVVIPGCDKPKFLCELCNVSFVKRGNLNHHLKIFHQLQVVVQGNQSCALCGEKLRTMALLHEHIQNQHSITLKFVKETFYSEKDFQDWKYKIEKESLSSFVNRNSTKRKDKDRWLISSYYSCHRSGQHKPKQNRIRNVKASGSIKTGSTCPAFMRVTTEVIDEITEIKVRFQSVHLGHDLDTRTLRLNRKDRENLAACLKLGIPMEKILDKAKQNFTQTNRFSLLTRTDLNNIRRDFGLRPKTGKPAETVKKVVNQNTDVEVSDISNGQGEVLEIQISKHEVQEHEERSAVSSLLQLQNPNYSEEFKNRKVQIINQLKELQSRIEDWDPLCPLPNVEEHIKAINAHLDISNPPNIVLDSHGILPILITAPANKVKRRRTTKPKNSKKKQPN